MAKEGNYTRNLIPVLTSTYLIPERLKEIDSNYFVMFNKQTQSFEIHHAGQPFQSYVLTVPYTELDARTIDYIQKTRRENIKKIIEEIDRENMKLELEHERKLHDASDFYAGEIWDWKERHTDEHIPADANTTRFV